MNPFEMVVLIVAMVMIAGVIKARYGIMQDANGNDVAMNKGDIDQLHADMAALKDRVAVLERLATDGSSELEREIEKLRDRA